MSKEHAIASRRLKWESVNWSNSDAAIARFMGVTQMAVHHRRRAAGEALPSRGGPRHKGKPDNYTP